MTTIFSFRRLMCSITICLLGIIYQCSNDGYSMYGVMAQETDFPTEYINVDVDGSTTTTTEEIIRTEEKFTGEGTPNDEEEEEEEEESEHHDHHDHEHHDHEHHDHEHHDHHDHDHHDHEHEHHDHEHHDHEHDHDHHDHEHHDHEHHDHEHEHHDHEHHEHEHHDHEHEHHDHAHHDHEHEHHEHEHHDHEHHEHEHHDHEHHDHVRHDHEHHDHEHHDHEHHDHEHHDHDHEHHDREHQDHHDHDHHDHEHHDHHDHDHHETESNFYKVLSENEKHPLTAITLTFVSGMAATVGGLFVICLGEPSPKFLAHLLSFAAGIMLYISYGDLLPHAIEDMDSKGSASSTDNHDHSHDHHTHGHEGHSHGPGLFEANMWMFGGMLFFLSISFVVHKFGFDEAHSHSHAHEHPKDAAKKESNGSDDKSTIPTSDAVANSNTNESTSSTAVIDKKKLMMTGIMAAIGITLHNLPEGLIVYNQTITGVCKMTEETMNHTDWWNYVDITQCLSRGVAITFAIALHNIPEGMAVASPIYASTGSRWEAFKYTFLSSIAEPLAAIIFGLFFSSQLTRHMMACLNATVAGIMICLCLTDLMPAAAQVVSPKEAAISNVLGQFAMFLSLHFMRSVGAH